MAGLILWKDREIDRMKRDMDRLFARMWDDFPVPFFRRFSLELPFIDLVETEDALIVTAEVPGMNAEDLNITIAGRTLTIRGEAVRTIDEREGGQLGRQRGHFSFSRNIELPCKVLHDHVEATCKEGVLKILMPKCAPTKTCGVRITVRSSSRGA